VIDVRIVIGWTAKYFDADGSLFEIFGPAFQGLFDDIPQETAVPPAIAERSACQDLIQVIQNGCALGFVQGWTCTRPLRTRRKWFSQSWTCHDNSLGL
jgi:hypothetical protein